MKDKCNSKRCPVCGTDDNVVINFMGGSTVFGEWAQVSIRCKKCGRVRHGAKIPVMYRSDDEEEAVLEKALADVIESWNDDKK